MKLALWAVQSPLNQFQRNTYFVSPDGNNSIANGRIDRPYQTIQAAITAIEASSISADTSVVIKIAPGTYTENVTLVRPRTHLVSDFNHEQDKGVFIVGNFVVSPTGSGGTPLNDVYSFHGIVFSATGTVFAFNGTRRTTVVFTRCYLDSGSGIAFLANNNTGGTRSRVYFNGTVLSTASSSACCDLTYGQCFAIDCDFTNTGSGVATALRNSASLATDRHILDQSGTGADCITLTGTSTLQISNASVHSTAANSDGFDIASGCTVISVRNVFNVPAGTGFAARGVAGVVYLYAQDSFLANDKVSTAIGAGFIAIDQTYTPA